MTSWRDKDPSECIPAIVSIVADYSKLYSKYNIIFIFENSEHLERSKNPEDITSGRNKIETSTPIDFFLFSWFNLILKYSIFPGYNKVYDDKSENPLNAENLINTERFYMEDFMPIKKTVSAME